MLHGFNVSLFDIPLFIVALIKVPILNAALC